jgi:hypothetical protein
MTRFKTIVLAIGCLTTLVLGSMETARAAGGSAARCAATLERLDSRLNRCAGRCIQGAPERIEVCASRCQETFEAERDVALAKPACEALSTLMTSPATVQALPVGGGATGLWCACKLNCDNDYSGMPVLIRACKELCDKQNKCRKSPTLTGGIVFIR